MKRILIADDNEQNLYMLKTLLTGHDYVVDTALNGYEALKIARKVPPDLIITDILMPVMDGYTLCREWKQDTLLQKIPFIFYTATYTDPKDKEFSLNLGAERFILKPAEPASFIKIIQEVLLEFSSGELPLSNKLINTESEYQQKYSERLVKKLEKKMLDLQQANAQLEEEVIRRKKAELLWKNTFNSVDELLIVLDKEMRIVRVNQAALHFCKAQQPEELIGKKCHEIFSPAPGPCSGCPVLETIEDKANHSRTIRHEPSKSIFQVSSSAILETNGELEHLVCSTKDITEQKRMEADLSHAGKMRAIGTLAGGVAHDFNNILSAIIGYGEFVHAEAPKGSDIERYSDQILAAAKRATKLVKKILTFSRKSISQREKLYPHLVVKETLELLHSTFPSSVFIEEHIDSDCSPILATTTDMHQVIMNLCVNGLQAMDEEKGRLIVELHCRRLSAKELPLESNNKPGYFVVLTVKDTGCGMDEATIDQIFEPYFTTKDKAGGTGLGLALVHGIVQSCKGFLQVESTIGQGSTFRAYFPALEERSCQEEISAQKERLVKDACKEGILVVDDEPLLVEINKKRLEMIGYRVTAATDGREALRIFRSQPEKFDLLITDQSMPGLSGAELAQAVLAIQPTLPIIMCTGHSETVSEEKALAMGIAKYVFKPLRQDELLDAVRELLDTK